MSWWIELLGGGGIVAALGGIGATFIRVGRFIEHLESLDERVARLEDRMDRRANGTTPSPTWRGRPAR